jgi:hypothetical protein
MLSVLFYRLRPGLPGFHNQLTHHIHDTVLKIHNIGNCNIDVKLRRKVLFITTLKARGHSVVAARKLHI